MPSTPTSGDPFAIAASTVGVGAHAASIWPLITARIASVPVVNDFSVTLTPYFE